MRSLTAWIGTLAREISPGRDGRRPHPDPLVEDRLLVEDQLDAPPSPRSLVFTPHLARGYSSGPCPVCGQVGVDPCLRT